MLQEWQKRNIETQIMQNESHGSAQMKEYNQGPYASHGQVYRYEQAQQGSGQVYGYKAGSAQRQGYHHDPGQQNVGLVRQHSTLAPNV